MRDIPKVSPLPPADARGSASSLPSRAASGGANPRARPLTAVKHGDAELGAFVLLNPASEECTLGLQPRRLGRVFPTF